MTKFAKVFLFFVLSIVAVSVLPSIMYAQKQKIEGEVLTNDNRPIPSVTIRAYRGSIKVGDATTGSNGKYLITFDSGDTITMLRYDCTSWDPASIDNVSGKRDHAINKVMYPVGSKLSKNQAFSLLLTLQTVYFVDTNNDIAPHELGNRYAHSLELGRFPQEAMPVAMKTRELYGLTPF